MKIYCDLHIHSCLSPCGDGDMTPNNIANMAMLKGLHCIALTDHNSCGNCRSTAVAARRAGIGFLPGMELTTAEDIHAVCLFPDCDHAEAFDRMVYAQLPPIRNKPHIFGPQEYRDAQDVLLGYEERLLITATRISIIELEALTAQYGGICFPAHIDREANGIIAVLGAIPQECSFAYAEVSNHYTPLQNPAVDAALQARRMLRHSDAHYLWDISEAQTPFLLGEDPLSRMLCMALRQVESPFAGA